jgi:predicted CopG family antitoxin
MPMTTIQVDQKVRQSLEKIKEHPRQTYNEVIMKIITIAQQHRNQYDEFLHKIQQPKMKELWDNNDDEAWEYA